MRFRLNLEKSKPGVKSEFSPSGGGTQLGKKETLSQAGLTKSVANRYEKIADIPEGKAYQEINKYTHK